MQTYLDNLLLLGGTHMHMQMYVCYRYTLSDTDHRNSQLDVIFFEHEIMDNISIDHALCMAISHFT